MDLIDREAIVVDQGSLATDPNPSSRPEPLSFRDRVDLVPIRVDSDAIDLGGVNP